MRLTSPKAYRVVKYLLQHKKASQLEISRRARVALGWTNEVINFLFERGIISKGGRRCELTDPFKLLEIIALERPLSGLVGSSFRIEALTIAEGEELLKRTCNTRKVNYALTAFSGLRRYYEYYIGFPRIDAYVSDQKIEAYIPRGQGPITLNLLSSNHDHILKEAREVDGASTCSPIQVVIDLFCSGVGRDAAIKLLEAIYDGRIRDTVSGIV